MILQAAATGRFNFAAVGPRYFTRLKLIIEELYRLNQATAAAHSALHCVISTVMADEDSKKKNYARLRHNRALLLKMLHLPEIEDDNTNDPFACLKQAYEQLYGTAEQPTKNDAGRYSGSGS